LYHRMTQVIDITKAQREWPSSAVFLEEATKLGGLAEIEKPFWWDTPLWLSTGRISSVGIAQNHMQRRGVLESEAWGRARDRRSYPGVHGNGLYTQDLYYKILNCGLRLPPSAGSASGVLANPVGYNRVYVHTEGKFGWDAWWEGLRKGRCFVTNGPLLRLSANRSFPGGVLKSEDALEVKIEGRIDSRDKIKRVEIVENGVVREIKLPGTITIKESGWFLVRAIADVEETFRFASTAPWYVEIGGATMKPHHDSASFFLKWAKVRKAMVEKALKHEEQRSEVSAVHQRAVAFWEKIVAVSSAAGQR